MRREAVLSLEEALLEKVADKMPAEYPKVKLEDSASLGWTAYVTTMEQLEVVLKYPEIKTIYWEWCYNNEVAEEALDQSMMHGKAFYLALPPIMKESMYQVCEEALLKWEQTSLTGFLVRNVGEYHFLKSRHKKMVIDYNMNITNNEALALWQEKGAERVTVSVELSPQETTLLEGNKEKIVYGHLPVMTSSQCVLRGTSSCQKGKKEKHYFELEDRKEIPWRIQTDCKACMMQIMSYEPLAYRKSEMPASGYALRLQFTSETGSQTEEVIKSYLRHTESRALKGTTFKGVL